MSYEMIIKKYVAACINDERKSYGVGYIPLFFEDGVIYSFGRHFPIATCIRHGKEPMFLFNGDDAYYGGGQKSRTTPHHQGRVRNGLKPHKVVTVSFSALESARVLSSYSHSISAENILDYANEIYKECVYHPKTGNVYMMKIEPDENGNYDYRKQLEITHRSKMQGSFVEGKNCFYNENIDEQYMLDTYNIPLNECRFGYWHTLGGTLIRDNFKYLSDREKEIYKTKKRYFLCALDERSYFVSQLPRACKTVKQAYKMLQPEIVKDSHYDRQGEWFFVDTGRNDKQLAKELGIYKKDLVNYIYDGSLPKQHPRGNDHKVKMLKPEYSTIFGKDVILCKGAVKHPEHKTLKLGQSWHVAYRNTELASWSQQGNFD